MARRGPARRQPYRANSMRYGAHRKPTYGRSATAARFCTSTAPGGPPYQAPRPTLCAASGRAPPATYGRSAMLSTMRSLTDRPRMPKAMNRPSSSRKSCVPTLSRGPPESAPRARLRTCSKSSATRPPLHQQFDHAGQSERCPSLVRRELSPASAFTRPSRTTSGPRPARTSMISRMRILPWRMATSSRPHTSRASS